MPLEIIQDIGSYAGFAAVVGLAVLSALYFSQARDLKRLREWAGRAPERAADQPQPARVVAQPQQRAGAPGAAPPPAAAAATAAGQGRQPAAQPANGDSEGEPAERERVAAADAGEAVTGVQQAEGRTEGERVPPEAAPVPSRTEEERQPVRAGASAAAAGAAPASAMAEAHGEGAAGSGEGAAAGDPREGAATPAGQAQVVPRAAAAAPPATPSGGGSDTAATEPAGGGDTAAPERGAERGAEGGVGPPGPATRGGSRPPARAGVRPGGSPPVPGRSGRPPARGGLPRPAQTAIIPPPSRAPWYRRLLASPRYLVLAIAGLLIVGGGAAFAVVELSRDDAGSQASSQQAGESGGGTPSGGDTPRGEGSGRHKAVVQPKTVTVAVLNGTTVPGLAAQLGDKIEGFGFELGNVTNSTDQQRAESVVLFAPGHEREAAAVSRRLRVGQRERIDAQTQGLAGDASVVVVAGTDQTR